MVGSKNGAVVGQSRGKLDPVEAALVHALEAAAEGAAWGTVEALAAELRARREERSKVVRLDVVKGAP